MKSLVVYIMLCGCVAGLSAEFYVSPTANGGGNGSISTPWTIDEAITNTAPVSPGDTLYLRGGTYTGRHWYRLNGTAENPITVTKYQNEKPVFDGAGCYEYCLFVYGSWTIFRDFEVTNSKNDRSTEVQTGMAVIGPNNRMLNLLVRNVGGTAIGWWSTATNSEVSGCVLYNNGTSSLDHGVYLQNNSGNKILKNNISFNNWGYGFQGYGNQGKLVGVHLTNNIAYNNGSLAGISNLRERNFFFGSLDNSISDLVFVGNHAFMPFGINSADNYFIGYVLREEGGQMLGNSDATMLGNVSSGIGVQFNYFTNIVCIGNTNVSANGLGVHLQPTNTLYSAWNSNVWYFPYVTSAYVTYPTNSKFISVAAYKTASGNDEHSTFITGATAYPSNAWTYVYSRDDVDGRANVVIYNWALAETVPVDLSPAFSVGDPFEIRAPEDYYAEGTPILTGVFDGNPVSVPTGTVAFPTPIGIAEAPDPVSPLFHAYVAWKTTRRHTHTIGSASFGAGSIQ